MLTRRTFVITLGTCAIAVPFAGFGKSPAKVRRIGFVADDRALATGPRFEALRAGLRLLGHVEPQNLALTSHWPEGKDHTFLDLAGALIDAKLDVVVAYDSVPVVRVARALKRFPMPPIPLVMATCPDPVRYGVVANLARPGGNVTGLADSADVAPKQLALLAEAVAGLSRVAVLAHDRFPGHPDIVNSVRAAAQKSGTTVFPFTAQSPADIDTAFGKIAKARAQAVLVAVDVRIAGVGAQIAALAIQHKLPTIFGARALAEAGGLMSYGEDINDTYRRAAVYVDKIIRGAKPGALPVTQADKFEFIINRKTAAALGVKLSAALLARADRTVG